MRKENLIKKLKSIGTNLDNNSSQNNNSFQLKRLDEIIKINQNDFSLNFDSNDEKFFDGKP